VTTTTLLWEIFISELVWFSSRVTIRGLKACGIDVENFVFIAVEKEAPYQVCAFAADDTFLKLGETDALADLDTYTEAVKTNVWSGYENKIHSLALPGWVRTGE